MTPEQILAVMEEYRMTLMNLGYDEKDTDAYKRCPKKALYQASACCNQVIKWTIEIRNSFAPVEDKQKLWDKMNRWIGFIQGVLWVEGIYLIDEMGGHNRSKST